MHYHVVRYDYDTRTCRPMDPAGVGIAADYIHARAIATQDEKQFRLPSAERWVLHRWECWPCKDDEHRTGPSQKGHSVR